MACATVSWRPSSSIPANSIDSVSSSSKIGARVLVERIQIQRQQPWQLKKKRSVAIPGLVRVRALGYPSENEDSSHGVTPYLARKGAKLFAEESIGAQHGEGFSMFRPTGPLHVDVDFLNDRMQERGLRRIRYAMKPDEAFGLIFSWDNVLLNTHALRMVAWSRLAAEEGKKLPSSAEKQKQLLCMNVERGLEGVLDWGEGLSLREGEVARLTKRLATLYCEELAAVQVPMEGLRSWLDALLTAGVPCAIASSMDRLSLLGALQRMGLLKYFRAVVSEEDGMDSIAHRFLSAAVKLDRPPAKCVVFEDDPRGVVAAHNCTMKAVAIIGSHPAYELTQADLAVSSFADLSVMNLRRLFANKGAEFMDLQKQSEPKKPAMRKITMDTWY